MNKEHVLIEKGVNETLQRENQHLRDEIAESERMLTNCEKELNRYKRLVSLLNECWQAEKRLRENEREIDQLMK